MKVTITNKDIRNLKVFMLLHSKKAKKQKAISTYAIPFEFLLVGIILDGLLKLAPVLTIASIVLSILWLIIYPRFYRRLLNKHLKQAEQLENSSVEMNFEISDGKVKFYNGDKPKPSEIFELDSVNRVIKSEENYIIAFKEGHHIVLPISDEAADMMGMIKAHFKYGDIENISLN